MTYFNIGAGCFVSIVVVVAVIVAVGVVVASWLFVPFLFGVRVVFDCLRMVLFLYCSCR